MTGACFCKAIKYEVLAESMMQGLCYCADCQTVGGSAYWASYAISPESFRLTSGEGIDFFLSAFALCFAAITLPNPTLAFSGFPIDVTSQEGFFTIRLSVPCTRVLSDLLRFRPVLVVDALVKPRSNKDFCLDFIAFGRIGTKFEVLSLAAPSVLPLIIYCSILFCPANLL